MSSIRGQALAVQLCKAMGIDPYTVATLTIRFTHDGDITVTTEGPRYDTEVAPLYEVRRWKVEPMEDENDTRRA